MVFTMPCCTTLSITNGIYAHARTFVSALQCVLRSVVQSHETMGILGSTTAECGTPQGWVVVWLLGSSKVKNRHCDGIYSTG